MLMESRKNLFVLRYNKRDDDLGDQFILRALADSLADFGTVMIRKEVPSFLPGMRPEKNGWQAKWNRLLTTIRGAKVFDVLPPGALLRPNPRPAVEHKPGGLRSKVSGAIAGKKISLGRSVIPDADHTWCQHVDWIGVRDDASIQSLHDAGYQHVTYFPDLAFMVQPSILPEEQASKIAISFRDRIPEDLDPDRYTTLLDKGIDTLMKSLRADDAERMLAFHQVDEDASYVAKIAARHGIQNVKQEPITLSSYQSFYQQVDWVFSNRLHCLLMGALCGAIPVALTTGQHTKVVSLYETVGWQSLILKAEEADQMPDQLATIQSQADEFRHLVQQTLDEQRTLGNKTLASLVADAAS